MARAKGQKRLFESAQAGDTAAFSEIYRRNRRGVYQFCLSRLHDPALAERAAQETWVRFLTVDSAEHRDLKGWLFGLAAGACDEVTALATQAGPYEQPEEMSVVEGACSEPWREDCERSAATALARMKPSQRTALVLSELHGFTPDEMSAALGRTPQANLKLIESAKARFCRLYADLRHLPIGCTVAFPLIYDDNGASLDEDSRAGLEAHLDACPHCQQEVRWTEKQRVLAAALPLYAAIGHRVDAMRLARIETALGLAFTANPDGAVPPAQRYSVRAVSAFALAAIIAVPAAAFVMSPGTTGGDDASVAEKPPVEEAPQSSATTTTTAVAKPKPEKPEPEAATERPAPQEYEGEQSRGSGFGGSSSARRSTSATTRRSSTGSTAGQPRRRPPRGPDEPEPPEPPDDGSDDETDGEGGQPNPQSQKNEPRGRGNAADPKQKED